MLNLLREARVLQGLTGQELEEIAQVCESINFPEGSRIFEAGSPAECLYIVSEGAVELRSQFADHLASREIAVGRKKQGEFFGWSAVTEPHTYTLSAVAAEDSQLLRIKKNDIGKMCSENTHFGYVLMKNIAEILGERFNIVWKLLMDEVQEYTHETESSIPGSSG